MLRSIGFTLLSSAHREEAGRDQAFERGLSRSVVVLDAT
jgi:hypothetical protein